jgi:hypothetical protein
MSGTCMVGIMKKPRKQRELSNTLQRGVKAVLQRTSAQALAARADRKRKPRGADAGVGVAAPAAAAGDAVLLDAAARPPAKPQRRTTGPSTRQQQLLAAVEAATGDALQEGGSESQTGAHEGAGAGASGQQPASSSHTAGSQPQAGAQAPRASAAHSFRSSSGAGLSGPMLDGSMGQVRGAQPPWHSSQPSCCIGV